MNTNSTLNLQALKQLQAVSVEMCTYAENGDWPAVLVSDHKRLQILQKQDNSNIEGEPLQTRKALIAEILEFDKKIREYAGNERRQLMNKTLQQQAQLTAKTHYQQALNPDS